MVRMSLQACCSSLALNHQWCLVTLKQNKMQGIFINVILLVLHVKNQLYFILKFKTWKWEQPTPLIMSNTKLCYIRDETKEVFLLSYHITINVMKSYRKYHKNTYWRIFLKRYNMNCNNNKKFDIFVVRFGFVSLLWSFDQNWIVLIKFKISRVQHTKIKI